MKRLLLWWKFEGRYLHKDIYQGIKNLIKWFPIIWKDRNWDHRYIYDILKFKIKTQGEFIGKRGNHLNASRDAERMLLAYNLMTKVSDEYYALEKYDYEESKFDFIPVEGEKYLKMEIKQLSDNLEDYFKKYPRIYKNIVKKYPDLNKHDIAYMIVEENQRRAHKLLYRYLETWLYTWWD